MENPHNDHTDSTKMEEDRLRAEFQEGLYQYNKRTKRFVPIILVALLILAILVFIKVFPILF